MDAHNYIHLLCRKGKTFTVIHRGLTTKVYLNGSVKTFTSGVKLPRRELGLISRVKKDAEAYVKNNSGKFDFPKNFISIKPNTGSKFNGVMYDIKAAYWNEAREIFLSKSTYDLGIENKLFRLRALGVLAIKTNTVVYENGIRLKTDTSRPQTAFLFSDIAKRITSKMECSYEIWPNVFTHYVDSFSIKGDAPKDIEFEFSKIFNNLHIQPSPKFFAVDHFRGFTKLIARDGKGSKHYVYPNLAIRND